MDVTSDELLQLIRRSSQAATPQQVLEEIRAISPTPLSVEDIAKMNLNIERTRVLIEAARHWNAGEKDFQELFNLNDDEAKLVRKLVREDRVEAIARERRKARS